MKSLLTIVIIFALCSCRKLVQDKFPDFETSPTIYCILEEGKPVKIHLSWAAKIENTSLKMIDNADIELYINGKYNESFNYTHNGMYTSSVIAASVQRYQCLVHIPGRETIVVTDSLPAGVTPTDITYTDIAGWTEDGLSYPSIRFTFANSTDEKRYYEAVVWKIRKESNIKYSSHLTEAGPVTDPILKSEGLPVAIFSNEKIEGSFYTMTVNILNTAYSKTGDGAWIPHSYPYILELRSVSYDYYCYAKQRYLYELGFEPYFDRVVNPTSLYSNITSGYGIFAGYSAVVSDTLNFIYKGEGTWTW